MPSRPLARPKLQPQGSDGSLARWLQVAYSGELGAALAYRGHAQSVSDPVEKAEIFRIASEELDHRERVGRMLGAIGAAPDPRLEARTARIGRLIAAFCRIGGWFLPMYGAGLIERRNIVEYCSMVDAARREGHPEFVEDLADMADVERDHERYFRRKAASHPLWILFPKWTVPVSRPDSAAAPAKRLSESTPLGRSA